MDASFETPLLLGSQIFQFLREQIITGKLREGTRLTELALQKALRASRSPIREAFRHLEVEGLVRTYTGESLQRPL
jgi:DNA-binding GntR family transcriptional regulator